MRRRVFREVGTIAGVVAILIALALANGFMRRSSLAEEKIAERQAYEKLQEEQGVKLLKWPLLQDTTGGYKTGPTFAEELNSYHDQEVAMMGFQVPVEQFRDMTEFLILPMPIECYFCERPPMKDVVLVQMAKGETAPLIEQPVLIRGKMKLHTGPKTSFFYTIEDATWVSGTPDKKTTRRSVDMQHQIESTQQPAQEELSEGYEVPQAQSVEEIIQGAGEPAAPQTPAPLVDGPVTPPAAPTAATPAAPAPAVESAPVPPSQ